MRIRAGDVVIGRFRSGYQGLVVKRATEQVEGGWLLASDNPFGGSSSGVGDVEGRVVLRLRPWPPARLSRPA